LCDRLEAQQQERETRHAALARASLARFADAPTPANLPFLFHPSYAIPPADLRKSILTLAVQGKLVPQDPNDEPAEEILRRSKVDLKRWAVAPDEERQAAPDSWTWIRFAGVGEQRLGKMLDAQKNRGELKPYLRNTNVQWMRFELDDVKDMRVEEREVEELRLKAGDLLICEGGEPGRCAIWRDEVGEMYFQKAIHRVRPCDAVTSEFLALNLQIDCANGVLAGFFTGATIKHLTGRSLAAYPVPIPPLAEQRRIVAKVEQLMALVDALETQLAASRATAANLLSALVAELTA
jgi:type I restriction enzyme S subunit